MLSTLLTTVSALLFNAVTEHDGKSVWQIACSDHIFYEAASHNCTYRGMSTVKQLQWAASEVIK